MRILVSDYSGHPFQVQLSRALAARGHQVRHVSSSSFQTPKGRLAPQSDDPATFESVGVTTNEPFAKSSFFKRRSQEIEIGRRIAEQVADFRPDIVVSSNAPLDTQRHILAASRKARARFVFWVQDLYGEAISRILSGKIPVAGHAIGAFYKTMEASMLRRSDGIVVIADDFVPEVVKLARVPRDRITTIENWAPLDEIPSLPRDNDWARAHLPDAAFRMIYSGTLGFKHNPDLLLALAKAKVGEMIVFSEGAAAESLKRKAQAEGLTNLRVSGWLPFADLPKALAGADAVVVIIEPDAGIFSVPSKVLTYLAVGRPILGAMPAANLASRIIAQNDAGIVVEPQDELGLVAAATRLAANRQERISKGLAARAYAERTFDIDNIASKFESLFNTLVKGPSHG